MDHEVKNQTPDLRVGFILQPGFTLLAFSGFVDILRHAADQSDQSRQILCTWAILGDPDATICASSGLRFFHDTPYQALDPANLDYVVVVGGLLSQADDIDPAAYSYLHAARRAGTGIVALCTGYNHLIRAGLMDHKRCCVHWVYERQLKDQYPAVIPVLGRSYVEDDNMFTALGGIAGMELALELVERHCGRQRSRKCANRLCIDTTFSAQHPKSVADLQFEVSGNTFLENAVKTMHSHMDGSLTVEKLATNLGITDRQLRSIFRKHTGRSPAQFWRDIRLHEARWRLANTPQSVTEIAYTCGFSDSSHLSKTFFKTFRTTPRDYRALRITADNPAATASVEADLIEQFGEQE